MQWARVTLNFDLSSRKQAVGGRPPQYVPAPLQEGGAEAPSPAEQTAT